MPSADSPLPLATLLQRPCRPLEGESPMTLEAIEHQLPVLRGWTFSDGAIEKTFAFTDFHLTIGFVNALAWICNAEDHHPALAVSYGRCVVRFDTHSVGGVSINDFVCAAKADALIPNVA